MPQLLGRPFSFPFGVITICVHVNSISVSELERIKEFVTKHAESFVSFSDIDSEPVKDSPFRYFLRGITYFMLKCMRAVRKSALGDLT